MNPSDYLLRLCGRRLLDGTWETLPAHSMVRETALNEARASNETYYLRIRRDAVEAYKAARARVKEEEDGSLPAHFRAPGGLAPETHRLEDIYQTGSCALKVGSVRKREHLRQPRHEADQVPLRSVHENNGQRLSTDEALPCSLHLAMSLLARYGLVLEPCELPKREPVKLDPEPEPEEPKTKTSGRKRASRVKDPDKE